MNRYRLLLGVFVLCTVSTLVGTARSSKPNLVIFLSDDHGYLDWSLAGDTGIRTPHLQRIAEQGMTFTRGFAASPSCAPSRAALLTGLMPARNGWPERLMAERFSTP